GQHRRTCLRQDLAAGQLSRFLRVVGVLDAAAGGSHVLGADLQVGDGRAEAVLDRTQVGAGLVHHLQRVVQVVQLAGAGAGGHARDAEAGGGDATQGGLQVGQRQVDLVVVRGIGADLQRDGAAAVQQVGAVEL